MQTKTVGYCFSLTLVMATLCFTQGCRKSKGTDGVRPISTEDALARLRSVNNLKIMGMTISSFNNLNRLPPIDGTVPKLVEFVDQKQQFGTEDPQLAKLAGLSWRVHIMHYTETDQDTIQAKEVYAKLLKGQYSLARNAGPVEPWNLSELSSIKLSLFASPVPNKTSEPWLTYYRVFVGGGAAFERGEPTTWNDFPDGLDKTILVVEAGEAVPWPKPEELEYDPAKPLPKLGGLFPDGFYAVFADAKVRFIPRDTDEKVIRAMITRNGGEKFDLPPEADPDALRSAAGLK